MGEGAISTICAPALVYLSFSLVQIIIDIYKTQFYTAFFKFWTMLLVTTILNILCERGLATVSWFFVFIPIITMTILLVILIYFLGFNPGQINKKFKLKQKEKQEEEIYKNSFDITELIRREIELQKTADAEDNVKLPDEEEVVKIDETLTDKKIPTINPLDFS